MLITTYVLLTLSVEQKKERSFIAHIRNYLLANAGKQQEIDPAHLQAQLDELAGFAETRHRHKLERCLMPAVRLASAEATPLLADLELLGRTGGNMLRSVRRRLHQAFAEGGEQLQMLCRTLERYCQNLLERLAKEEQELLPLARRVISNEQWFAIGAMFLSHDAGDAERQRLRSRVE